MNAVKRRDADRHHPKRNVKAKVGKPPVNKPGLRTVFEDVNLLGFGVKAGHGSKPN